VANNRGCHAAKPAPLVTKTMKCPHCDEETLVSIHGDDMVCGKCGEVVCKVPSIPTAEAITCPSCDHTIKPQGCGDLFCCPNCGAFVTPVEQLASVPVNA
jgi:ribosomal protein S27AE